MSRIDIRFYDEDEFTPNNSSSITRTVETLDDIANAFHLALLGAGFTEVTRVSFFTFADDADEEVAERLTDIDPAAAPFVPAEGPAVDVAWAAPVVANDDEKEAAEAPLAEGDCVVIEDTLDDPWWTPGRVYGVVWSDTANRLVVCDDEGDLWWAENDIYRFVRVSFEETAAPPTIAALDLSFAEARIIAALWGATTDEFSKGHGVDPTFAYRTFSALDDFVHDEEGVHPDDRFTLTPQQALAIVTDVGWFPFGDMAAHDVRVEDVVAIHNRLKNHLVTAYNVPVDNYITRKDTPIINEGLVI